MKKSSYTASFAVFFWISIKYISNAELQGSQLVIFGS